VSEETKKIHIVPHNNTAENVAGPGYMVAKKTELDNNSTNFYEGDWSVSKADATSN